jgi:hypothetical protein
MNFRVKHKLSNRTISMLYSHWIHKIVNKGEANDYLILEYPDIVQLVNIGPDGSRTNDKIIERKTAQQEVGKYPSAYAIAEIDVKQQIISDIKLSNNVAGKKNKNQSSFWHLFSLKYQNQTKNLDQPSKRHMTMVVLMIITIIAMFVIAYFQGVFDNGV